MAISLGQTMGMLPLLMVPALIQEAPGLPPVFTVPDGLRIKPDSLRFTSYDMETFEIQKRLEDAPSRMPVKGRTWRFILESSGARAGILSLQQKFKPAIQAGGWVWQWEQRNVARLEDKTGEYWIKAGPSGGAALQVAIVRRGEPTVLTLQRPSSKPVLPAPDQDFPYVTPWPGSQLVASASSQAPVAADLGGGKQGFVAVEWIEKEYALKSPPSAYEFVTAYRAALTTAGWEIEGDFTGNLVQVQAAYLHDGRDIRLTLRLVGDAMAVSVADVGAQLPKKP